MDLHSIINVFNCPPVVDKVAKCPRVVPGTTVIKFMGIVTISNRSSRKVWPMFKKWEGYERGNEKL
ncbi:hypothetical protein CWO92_18075 [Heyndrickxia camelliae]|uniref:Uncharacterized protein n=1 Tax=Heyndrickxia camelliae TaxID=1707093 RepID=A0A2N3LGJ5_9BACI|nr:hypothetical protein CWO92_18075 [Heyndrickxia camelliae]